MQKLARAGFWIVLFLITVAPFAAQDNGPKFSPWSDPVSLGTVINSDAYDACPTISKSGLSLYFRSNRSGNYDIYVAQRDSLEDPWEEPVALGETINGPSDEYCTTFSTDGHWMIFVSNRTEDAYGSQDLWISHRKDKRDDFGWEEPHNLGPLINSSGQENGPCLFDDEATGQTFLYFSSGRPAGIPGFGGLNIWVAEALPGQKDMFGAPVLVQELSSNFTDYQPTIRKDGLELILASNRPGSIPTTPGGSTRYPDLWVATRSSTLLPWDPPEHLEVVNSSAFDFHPTLSWDGTTLIFASERGGAEVGWGDLYMSTRTKGRPDR